jgi:hypothetical protein
MKEIDAKVRDNFNTAFEKSMGENMLPQDEETDIMDDEIDE